MAESPRRRRASWRRRTSEIGDAPHCGLRLKWRCDPATKAYIARRTSEGVSERCATRFIKRFLARRIWQLLEHPPITA